MKTITSIGIDVSKATLEVACIGLTENSTRTYKNTEGGVREIVAFLTKQKTACTVPCVIESTGNYHLLSTIRLSEAGFLVNLINPLLTKKYQKSSIRNAKSDPIDAKRLAEIGLLEADLKPFTQHIAAVTVKKVISYSAALEGVRQKLVSSKNQLEKMGTLLDLPDLSGMDELIADLEKQIIFFQKYVVAHTSEEAKTFSKHVPGLSHERAAILIGLTGMHDFTSRDQLVAFAGLDIALRQSGTWAGKQRLSKRGNPYLRKVLYQVAWGLKTHNVEYKVYYDRLRKEGKHYTAVLMAIARKFLRHFYAFYWKKSIVYN